jgi:hypothetical protein
LRKHGRSRRLVAPLVAVIAAAAIAAPSSAGGSFATHFSVIAKVVRVHGTDTAFSFRDVLFNPANRDNVVGHDHGRCKAARGGKNHCVIVTHLDGSIGGFGDLLLRGNIARGDKTLKVVDGNGDFSGAVSGKAVIERPHRQVTLEDFALTR